MGHGNLCLSPLKSVYVQKKLPIHQENQKEKKKTTTKKVKKEIQN